LRVRGIWLTACLGLLLATAAATMIGCSSTKTNAEVTKSAVVSLTVN